MSDARSNGTSGDERIQATWSRIASCLEKQKSQLYEAIRNYPTPITACDQQFNYLLQQQAAISSALRRIEEAVENAKTDEVFRTIDEFLCSSVLDDEMKQTILATLTET